MNSVEIIVLFVGALFTSIGIILGYIEDKKTARKLAAVGIFFIFVSFGLTLWDSHQQDIINAAKSNNGEISSKLNNITYPCVQIGGLFSCYALGAVDFGNDIMSVRLENGKLIVSATVRDETGKIMGKITNNSFESYPPYALESRHDDNGWEVIDPYGRVALQVDLVGQYAHISGISYSMDGKSAMIAPFNGPLIFLSRNSSDQLRDNVTQIWEHNANIIPPLFDYSSNDYPSKRLPR
ncbi:MAG: hypothetical protein WB392_15200 [Methanotrichaceae archaeon]